MSCGSAVSTEGYRKEVISIGDEVFHRIAAADRSVPNPCSTNEREGLQLELKQARFAADASDWAVSRLRDLTPPSTFRKGHEVLIQYYELGARFSRQEARIAEGMLRGEDTASLEKELDRMGNSLFALHSRAESELPFLKINERSYRVGLGDLCGTASP